MASFRDQIQAHAGTGALLTRAQERALLRLGTAGYGLDYDNHYRELPHIAEVTFENGVME